MSAYIAFAALVGGRQAMAMPVVEYGGAEFKRCFRAPRKVRAIRC
jgi:hypothetical protein